MKELLEKGASWLFSRTMMIKEEWVLIKTKEIEDDHRKNCLETLLLELWSVL